MAQALPAEGLLHFGPKTADSAGPAQVRERTARDSRDREGATGPTGLREDVVVLDIAQRVKVNLEARGYAVVQTRLDDGYIARRMRLDIAIAKGQRSSSRSISTAISIQAFTGLKSGLTPKLHRPGLSRNPEQVVWRRVRLPWGIAVR